MRASRRLVVPCFLAVLVGACAAAPAPVPTIPEWISNRPSGEKDGSIYAVGQCGPTYYPEDSIRIATERARAALAESISVNIEKWSLLVTKGNASTDQVQDLTQKIESYSKVEVNNAEVVAVWHDRQGSIGQTDSSYVLVRTRIGGARAK